MAKRMTDSEKWGKHWFRLLPPKLKCMWEYLRDNCDLAGIWDEDYDLASFQIGDKITWEEVKQAFGDRVVRIPYADKIFLKGFVEFQYGELSETCKPHVAVIKALRKAGIDPVTLTLSESKLSLIHESPTETGEESKGIETLSEGYAKGIHTLKDKDKEKEKDKEKDQDKEKEKDSENFENSITQDDTTELTPPDESPPPEPEEPPKKKRASKPPQEGNLPELAQLWNEIADERLSKIREMAPNSARRVACENRWKERPDRAYWIAVIGRINKTPFCLGTNNRGWKADIEFLTRPDNHAKILEGKYDWSAPPPQARMNGAARAKTATERTESLDAEMAARMSEVQS